MFKGSLLFTLTTIFMTTTILPHGIDEEMYEVIVETREVPIKSDIPADVLKRIAKIVLCTAGGAGLGCAAGAGVGSAAGLVLGGAVGAQTGFESVNESSIAAGVLAVPALGAGLGAGFGSAVGLVIGGRVGTIAGAAIGFLYGLLS